MPDIESWSPNWPAPLPPPLLSGSPALYLSGEDGLQPTILNSAANVRVRMTGRFLPLGETGIRPFDAQFVPYTTRTAASIWVPFGQGWLLDAMLSVNGGAPQHGQTWARIAIVRGGPTSGLEVAQLAHGYVTAQKFLRWPYGATEAMLDGPGALRSISGTTPAAGAEVSETVPTGARWELLALFFQLVTSAAVANRFPTLVIDDGTNTLYRMGTGAVQTASTTFRRTWFNGAVASGADNANNYSIPIPERLTLGSGFRIRTTTSLIDVGDQYSLVQYLVREWLSET